MAVFRVEKTAAALPDNPYIYINKHFTGIDGEAARPHLLHFLLNQCPFLCGDRDTQHMLLVRFAIRSPSFPFPIRVWDYPNKQTRRHPAGRAGALFGSVATLPMLATASLFSLLLR